VLLTEVQSQNRECITSLHKSGDSLEMMKGQSPVTKKAWKDDIDEEISEKKNIIHSDI
jgi:hypothetical protein